MNTTALNANNIVDFLVDIFERRGADSYIGEDVTMSQHMLQTAMLAERDGADDETIAAALLHDIGHYTSEFREDAYLDDIDNIHEQAGARILEPYFPHAVTDAIRMHVAAKRYLCATKPRYLQQLSEASIISLRLQGGPMTPEEVEHFQRNPYFKTALRVRIWDDKAKDKHTITPDFKHYIPLLKRLV